MAQRVGRQWFGRIMPVVSAALVEPFLCEVAEWHGCAFFFLFAVARVGPLFSAAFVGFDEESFAVQPVLRVITIVEVASDAASVDGVGVVGGPADGPSFVVARFDAADLFAHARHMRHAFGVVWERVEPRVEDSNRMWLFRAISVCLLDDTPIFCRIFEPLCRDTPDRRTHRTPFVIGKPSPRTPEHAWKACDTPETTPKPTKPDLTKPLQTLLQTETPMTMRTTVQTGRPPSISDTPDGRRRNHDEAARHAAECG